jgi:hypothetical protein
MFSEVLSPVLVLPSRKIDIEYFRDLGIFAHFSSLRRMLHTNFHSVAGTHHFYAVPSPGKILGAAQEAPALTTLYSKPTFFKNDLKFT